MPTPFAFSTDKSEYVFSIRPTLVAALQAARDRYSFPSFLLGIIAWFPDGSTKEVPYEDLVVHDEDGRVKGWITDEDAASLAARLFPTD
jgi:hypothetical protein